MKIESLLLITGNKNKAFEFKEMLNIDELRFSSRELDLPEIQSMCLEEIGSYKTACALKEKIENYDAVLTDDTALFCDALNGLPGPLIKWFLETLDVEGLYDLVKDKKSQCTANCILSIGRVKTGEIIQFEGVVNGTIVSPRGQNGFGWDKIFLPNGYDQTYGEMEPDEKNKISHRTLALKKVKDWIIDKIES